MKLSEKIQEALREQQEINLSDPAVQKRLAAQWGYVPADAQPAPSFADAYQGAMEDVAIWKRRALKAEDLNRKFVAEINGMGGEREAALMAKLEAAEKERDTLRAKVEEMEKQESVAWQTRTRPAWNDGTWGAWRKCSEEYAEDIKKTPSLHDWLYEARALYALPGAKGE